MSFTKVKMDTHTKSDAKLGLFFILIKTELKAFQGDRRFVKSKHQWIVFDGPVDTLWVENLNTMLDETKVSV